jgi:hypothetical protein
MGAEGQRRTSSSLPAIGLLLIIAGVFYVSRSRLESSRPEMPSGLGYAVPEKDRIEARLWQDPFKVALDHKKTAHSSGTNETGKDAGTCLSPHCVNQISERTSNILRERTDVLNVPTVQVLLTIVRDGDFAEDHERRLRNRYAMLSALHLSGFTPEDSEHIQYFELAWTEKDELAKNIQNKRVRRIHELSEDGSEPLIVPFEWLRRERPYPRAGEEMSAKDPCEYVVVAWLPESAFSHRPLTRLAQVIDAIDRANHSNVRIDVIGPSYSETLRAMIDEIEDVNELGRRDRNGQENSRPMVQFNEEGLVWDSHFVDVKPTLKDLTIFSPWSTASPALLVRHWPKQTRGENSPLRLYEVIPNEFKKIGIKFVRTIGSDDLLAMHLIQELDRRGLDLVDDKAHIELISEWDTFYGRAFPLTFATMMESLERGDRRTRQLDWIRYASTLHDKMAVPEPDFPENVCIHRYIRGVDGRLPQTEQAKEKESGKPDESTSKWAYSENLELPLGRGQLDYVRRLARKIDDEPQRRWRVLKKPTAIGVVGSDVYDKLILLHALREQFGGAVLFMTDLDTRMLHRDQSAWARNTIVASNFGLELGEHYQTARRQQVQGEVPPFRDNYQTALFLACRIALGLREKLPKGDRPNNRIGDTLRNDPNKIRKSIINPRLFEIGRGRAVDLSVLSEEKEDRIEIHPPNSRWPGGWIFSRYLVLILLTTLFGVLLLLQLSPTLLKEVKAPLVKISQRTIRTKPDNDSSEKNAKEISEGEPAVVGWLIMLSSLLVVLFVVMLLVDHYRQKGEPFSLVTGVSIWPGEALRLIAAILSACFILKSLSDLKKSERELRRWFKLKYPDKLGKSGVSYKKWRDTMGSSKQLSQSNRRTWWRYRRDRIGIRSWETGKGKYQVDAQQLWREYRDRGTLCNRFHRLIPMSLTYFALGIALIAIPGFPNRPYRGNVSSLVDFGLLFLSVSSMIILIFFVVDATRLSLRLIRNLKEPTTRWSAKLVKRFKGKGNKRADGLAEWLDIRFIASHTQAVGKLIYYPFIVLLVMFAARNRYFDNWDFPISLIIIFLVNSTYALVGAMMLRREAEKARRVAMDRLQEKLVKATADCDDCRSKHLETMIEEIRFIRRGAFSPFTENPVVRIVFASGGVGLLTLLRFVLPS